MIPIHGPKVLYGNGVEAPSNVENARVDGRLVLPSLKLYNFIACIHEISLALTIVHELFGAIFDFLHCTADGTCQ